MSAGAAAECTAADSAAGFAGRERSRGYGWFLDLQLWCGFFREILSGVWCIASGGGQLDLFMRYGEYRKVLYELRSEEAGEEDAVSLQQVRMGTGRSGESTEILPGVR